MVKISGDESHTTYTDGDKTVIQRQPYNPADFINKQLVVAE